MKYLLLLFICITLKANAQNPLVFNKQLTESNNKWVAIKTEQDSVFKFGFIYMDPTAGLTIHDAGAFWVKNNKFKPSKWPAEQIVKIRLDGAHNTVAWIPADRLKELDVKETPDWLKAYSADTTSAPYLFRWGFTYNAANQTDKALYYLNRVKKIDPNYHGLEYEYIFAYNATRQFDKAITLLDAAIKKSPQNADLHKELLFAYVNSGKIDKAEEAYKRASSICGINEKTEMALNILSAYLMQKNKEKSKIWLDDIQTWFPSNNPNYANFQKMKEYQATLK